MAKRGVFVDSTRPLIFIRDGVARIGANFEPRSVPATRPAQRVRGAGTTSFVSPPEFGALCESRRGFGAS
ncbi:MAG: hypothetical protein IT436_02145 [Phycisphaerales bacterium]|nr:hypothetical protein [Phycisphaerales bacterium]